MTPATAFTIAAILGSYVIGSIPSGLWLGLRLRSVDIRMYGSKNIGATNTLRVLGKRLGIIALVCDMIKGALAVIIGYVVVQYAAAWAYTPIFCGVAAIFGHVFSLFLKFHGGKGVATSTGVFLALAWQPTLCAALVFFVVVVATRMVSAGSIAAAATLAITMFMFPVGPWLQAIGIAVAVLVVIKHRTNIVRILQGNESKLGKPSTP